MKSWRFNNEDVEDDEAGMGEESLMTSRETDDGFVNK